MKCGSGKALYRSSHRALLGTECRACGFRELLAMPLLLAMAIELGAQAQTPPDGGDGGRMIHLVAEDGMLDVLKDRLPAEFDPTPLSQLSARSLVHNTAEGDCLVWIGPPAGLPPEFWVGSFLPGEGALACTAAEGSALPLDGIQMSSSVCASVFLSSPKELPQHNVDEEIRADFLPLIEARDSFGHVVGWPGVLVSHYAPSLATGRFDGSEQYYFFFNKPAEALDPEGWIDVLQQIARRNSSGLQVRTFDVNYASIAPGERIGIRVRVQNAHATAAAVELRFYAKAPGDRKFQLIESMRRVPSGSSDTEAVCDFKPKPTPGLWTIRMEACVDIEQMGRLSVTGKPAPFDRRDLGFVVAERPIQTDRTVEVDGPNILIDGKEAFWAGTHYYPSSSWWEWAWRDFRVLKADQDFDAMRRAGYRVVRVWVDPVLDEPVLRAMDAAVWLAAQHGIVLDICVFNQWVRQIGYERPDGEHVAFDFRDPHDFNLMSISLRNLDLQREYMGVLSRRWKDAGNLVFNLSNECYIKDPDSSQIDSRALAWDGIPSENGTLRDTALFGRWAAEMRSAAREAGANQPIVAGYMFSTMDGGDSILGNTDSDIVPWHSYLPAERTASTLQYMDPACTNRPLLLEEFGMQSRDPEAHYDANAHYALAAGAAAAMSYEWGVSWMSRESCFWPLPLREGLAENPDPRWFAPVQAIGNTWSERGVGLCGTPSGFGYGSIYHGTPFPAGAAVALGRMGLMGEGFARAVPDEKTYVLIPEVRPETIETVEKTFARLWREKVIFGVWQETLLDRLPHSAHTLICPVGVSKESGSLLKELRGRNVDVYLDADDSWSQSIDVERVPIEPGEDIDLHVRRIRGGSLSLLGSQEKLDSVTLGGTPAVTLGLDRFAMIQLNGNSISLIEGTGSIVINGTPICSVINGRAILAAEEGGSLSDSNHLRLMVTEPTTIDFARDVTGLAVSDGRGRMPIAAPQFVGPRRSLDINRELARYVLHVSLER